LNITTAGWVVGWGWVSVDQPLISVNGVGAARADVLPTVRKPRNSAPTSTGKVEMDFPLAVVLLFIYFP